MPIQSELTRLRANVLSAVTSQAAILSAIADKGVTVPPGATLHDVPGLIGEIPGRAPEPEPADSVKIGDRWYHYVQIGNQLWIDENLDFKFTGCVIGQGSSSSEPRANYYNNDEATYGVNGNKYGLLYNWIAAKYLEDNKSTLLPEGWHVPSNTEWGALATAVGGSGTAGTELKSTTGWSMGNGDDSYGFAAFPAGFYNSGFGGLDSFATFWTTTEYSSSNAYYNYFGSGESMYSSGNNKSIGYSVRLVKDVS